MRIRFVRSAGKPDAIYVRRSNGSEVSWSFPTYGSQLPHDLVHLIVESEFRIRDGFWGRVDSGIDPSRVNAEANRIGGKNKYAGFGEDLRGLYLAESLANLSWAVPDFSNEARMERLRSESEKSGIPLPESVTLDTLRKVHARLDDLRTQWRALGAKGTIELTW
jgi:hypothetical protein